MKIQGGLQKNCYVSYHTPEIDKNKSKKGELSSARRKVRPFFVYWVKFKFSVKRRNPNASPTGKMRFGLSSFGPSGETRTRGILVPKARETFFLILSGPFPCFPLRNSVLCEPLVSTVSRCSGPVYGLICGQTLLPGQVRQFSLPPAGKAFPFPGPLYLRRTGYATVFRRAMPSDFGTPETKNTDFRTA